MHVLELSTECCCYQVAQALHERDLLRDREDPIVAQGEHLQQGKAAQGGGEHAQLVAAAKQN